MEYYSVLKKKKGTVTYVTAWMNLDDMMLSKISPSQKDKYYMVPLT